MTAAGEHKELGRRALRAMACAQQINDFAPGISMPRRRLRRAA